MKRKNEMNDRMKIMIAYDGSSYSEAAIDDLRLAGLPREGKALVVSVHDSILPGSLSKIEEEKKNFSSVRILSTVVLLEKLSTGAFADLRNLINRAVENVRLYLPEWKIEGKLLAGNPAQNLLRTVEIEKPDLIVAGSHGRTALGRFFLGSVSNEIANKADCSVRIVRGSSAKSISSKQRVLVSIDNSSVGESVVRYIGRRVWNSQTEVRLLAVDDGFSPHRISAVLPNKEQMLDWAVEQLKAIGLNVSVAIIKGEPKTVLFEEAESWNADSIFVAANKQNIDLALDETANGLVNGANCVVEIIR